MAETASGSERPFFACFASFREKSSIFRDAAISKSYFEIAQVTVSTDMLEAVRKLRPALASRVPSEAVLIYGGETQQKRSDVTVLPWLAIHERRW